MQEYAFTSYNERFPVMFEEEKTKLEEILPFATKIEHFGSTAVPGLGGKGILDIYVLVSKDELELSKIKLIESGYSFYNLKEMEAGSKIIFRKKYQDGDKIRKVNVHVGTNGIKDFEKCIAFRDSLRSNQALCREYEEVKKMAITKTKDSGKDTKENSDIYVEAKGSFIKSSIQKN